MNYMDSLMFYCTPHSISSKFEKHVTDQRTHEGKKPLTEMRGRILKAPKANTKYQIGIGTQN